MIQKKCHQYQKVKSGIIKGLLALAAVSSLSGPWQQVQASEPSYERVDRAIYHQHTGTEAQKGGCYQEAVYHTHSGNEASGGGCYQAPVYHSHQGSKENGGGCYVNPVYHSHQGSKESGGGCYTETYHVHDNDCKTAAACTISISKIRNCIDTWSATCHHHGVTTHGKWEVEKKHSACGAGTVNATHNMCNSCKNAGDSTHTYQKLNCSREGEFAGYEINCGKDGSSVDFHEAGCGRTVNDVDQYTLNCGRTKDSVDRYRRSCGKEESIPLGRISIINKTLGHADIVELEAVWEDYTGGELKLAGQPFLWSNSNGSELSRSSWVMVRDNGSYHLTLQITNTNIKRESLTATMQVKNVKGAANAGNQDSSPGNGNNNNNRQEPGGITGPAGGLSTATASPVTNDQRDSTGTVKKEAAIQGKNKDNSQAQSPVIDWERIRARMREKLAEPAEWEKPEVEVAEVLPAENMAEPETAVIIKEKEKNSGIPVVVRGICITLGVAAAGLAIVLLAAFLLRGVTIYNEEPDGRPHFVSLALIRREEDYYTLYLPATLGERIYTNHFCLRPGILFCIRHSQEELIIEGGRERTAVYIEDEIRTDIYFE